jgi:hypothetical protein
VACHLQINAGPDPVYHFDADPNPTFQFDADLCGSGSTTLQRRTKKPERSSLEGLVHPPFVGAEDGLIKVSCKSNREPTVLCSVLRISKKNYKNFGAKNGMKKC